MLVAFCGRLQQSKLATVVITDSEMADDAVGLEMKIDGAVQGRDFSNNLVYEVIIQLQPATHY